MRRMIAALLLPTLAGALAAEEIRLERKPADAVFRFRPAYRVVDQRPFSLVLGGGASKGLAHIGVFEVLEEEGLEEDFIMGTSAGALMGAFRAAGFSGADLRWAFNRLDFGRAIFDSRRRTAGLTLWEEEERQATVLRFDKLPEGWEILPGGTAGRAATQTLAAHLLRADALCGGDFSRLKVPFTCVASDLAQGKLQVFASGNLILAVRASMSIPGVFRPVRLGTQQLVDGGISQNLPVLEAKRLHPGALEVAVDVSDPWEPGPVGNPFSLVGKSLAQSVEVMTRLNREAADVLVRPDVGGVDIFDFHSQVDDLAERGRRAMTALLPEVERRLYGEAGERLLGATRWEVAGGGSTELAALAESCLPTGRPWLRRDAYRLLRKAMAQGFLAEGWLDVNPERSLVRIHGRSLPVIRRIVWEVPEAWKGLAMGLAHAHHLEVGQPFREQAWGAFRQRVLMEASLQGRPLVNWREGGLSDSGELRIALEEAPVGAIAIDPAGLRPASRSAIGGLLEPLRGRPLDTQELDRRLRDADQALNIQNAEVRFQRAAGEPTWNLVATASDACRVQVNAAAAYESTWGLHGVVDVWVRDLLVKGNDWRFHGSVNRIQQGLDLSLRHTFQAWPSTGWFAGLRGNNQRFYGDPFLGYFGAVAEPTPYQRLFDDASQRSADAFAGFFQRFGSDRKGLVEIEYQRREALLVPAVLPRFRNAEDCLVLSTEWDSFDRHSFPTEGLLVRVRGMAGRARTRIETDPTMDAGLSQIRSAYLLFRALAKDLVGPVGADLALESGLGWHTVSVSDRQYILGGDASLIGTPSTRFLAPNFAILRAGLPIALRRAFGGHVQLVPRLDIGRFAEKPTDLSAGMRVVALGASVRGAVGKLNLETGWGQVQIRPFGPGPLRKETQLNILIGARPFDLWMRK
jgi:predicted acylesterase/phospholipase RssA